MFNNGVIPTIVGEPRHCAQRHSSLGIVWRITSVLAVMPMIMSESPDIHVHVLSI